MTTERARLRQLRRLERLRAIAKADAARHAATAEAALGRIAALAGRARSIDAGTLAAPATADDLAQQRRFAAGLAAIAARLDADAAEARAEADARQSDLAHAERRRAAIGPHIDAAARLLARRPGHTVLPVRRPRAGTGLE